MSRIYVKPAGLVHGSEARSLVKAGLAGRLAGGIAAFSAVEVMTRGSSEHLTYIEAAKSPELRERLRLLEAPRPDFAGLSMVRPVIMGIINVTPDSFSDGGQAAEAETAVAQGRRLAAEGAAILDVGGESTRPGSELVPAAEELARVEPVIRTLADEGFLVSADTRKPDVMRAAAGAGAHILNDVSALGFSPESPAVAAALGRPIVLMHAQGDPKTMQQNPVYDDVVLDVFDALEGFIARAEKAGVARGRIVVDPGIGFGKTFRHNLELLNNLALFHGLGVPLLLGASRKAFIGAITGQKQARDRMAGSVGVALHAASQGCQIIRVHDVRETVEALAGFMAVTDPETSGI